MQYVSMAVVGLLAGILARYLYPGAVPMGWLASIGLGIAGSFLAGIVGNLVSKPKSGEVIGRAGFIYSVIGAMALIYLARNVFHWV